MSGLSASFLWFGCAVLFLFPAGGCSDDSDDSSPAVKYRILDEGAGETNTESLSPVRTGMTLWNSDGKVLAHVGLPVKLGDTTVLPMSGAGQADWYSVTGDGLLYHGNSHAGRKPKPVLMMPATVRVGMRWQSWVDGGEPALEGLVLAREIMTSMWGRLPVWQIKKWDPRLENGDDALVRYYVEGRGRIEKPDELYPDEELPAAGVLPLLEYETPPPTGGTRPEALYDGEVLLPDRKLYHVTLVDPGHGESVRLRLDALRADSEFTNGSWKWHLNPTAHCFQLTPDATPADMLKPLPGHEEIAEDEEDEVCPDAAAVTWDEGGKMQVKPLSFPDNGLPLVYDIDSLSEFLYGGLFRMDGTPMIFHGSVREDVELGTYTRWGWGTLESESPDSQKNLLTGNVFRAVRRLWNPIPNGFALPFDGSSSGFGLGPIFGTELGFARFDGRIIRDVGTGLVFSGDLSSAATPEGRRFFATEYDGRVREVVVEPDGLRTSPVTNLDLPDGNALIGAVVHDGTLYAFSLKEQDVIEDLSRGEPPTGDVCAWRLELGELDSPEPPVPPVGNIRVTKTGADVEVCWPRGAGEPILTGWTLAGESVEALPATDDGSCILLLRPFDTEVDTSKNGAYCGEGPVPGIGRIAFGIKHGKDYTTNEALPGIDKDCITASTGDGRSTSLRYTYARSGLVDGAPPYAIRNIFGFTVPLYSDLGGDGLWLLGQTGLPFKACGDLPSGVSCAPMRFTGAPKGFLGIEGRWLDGNEAMLNAVGGGGVLVRWHDEGHGSSPSKWLYSIVYGDGTWYNLPELKSISYQWDVALADKTACRFGKYEHFECKSPDGTEISIPLADSSVGRLLKPVSERILYAFSGYQMHERTNNEDAWARLDLDSQEVTDITVADIPGLPETHTLDQVPEVQLHYDGKQRLFGLAMLETAEPGSDPVGWELLHFTPDGIQMVDTSALKHLFEPGVVPELVGSTRDFFFLRGSEQWGTVRLPRDDW